MNTAFPQGSTVSALEPFPRSNASAAPARLSQTSQLGTHDSKPNNHKTCQEKKKVNKAAAARIVPISFLVAISDAR